MNKKFGVMAAFFAIVGMSAIPSHTLAASADKTCKRVAKSAGMMSSVIDSACSDFKEYQTTCLAHVNRDGIPDLVRADNYMSCLCGESKQALRSDASQVCHASGSIHGLLDSYMIAVQSAARDTDYKQAQLSSREGSLERLLASQELAKKDADKADKAYAQIKSKTDKARDKNKQAHAHAQKIYEQTVAKLRAAERAAKAKFEGIEQELAQDNAKLRQELAVAQRASQSERSRHTEVSHAVSLRQRDVGRAKNLVATAQRVEKLAVERHRQSMSPGQTQVVTKVK